MEEYDWIVLSKIGEGKTMSQISNELFITQPALTYRINKIEKEFGTTLFIRGNKGIQVNHQGEHVINYANRMLEELNNTKEQVLSLGSQIKGKLYIGASKAVAQYILPNLLTKFLNHYPDVEPHVLTGFSPYLVELLSKGKVHIALLRDKIEWPHFTRLLTTESIYLVSKNKIDMETLPQIPRIDYQTNQSLKTVIDAWWSKNFQSPPNITMVVDNADVSFEFVQAGLGYSILTELCLSKDQSLHMVPLQNHLGEFIYRETWLYGSKISENYLAVKAFLSFIEKEYGTSHRW
ncbi:LysR family transcriptional regulator [Halalkalibacter oceani]|uniref:LysR family transcriptional regulator n=1 Tax=Halalkalibacter oceani TaxID=1653776 RepID=UPI003398CC5F